MRHLVAVGVILFGLVGCETFGEGPKAVLVGCDSYAATLQTLAGFRAAGKLTEAQIALVDSWRPSANEICSGEIPTTVEAVQTLDRIILQMIIMQQGVQTNG